MGRPKKVQQQLIIPGQTEKPVWEQLDTETTREYFWFCHYRDTGLDKSGRRLFPSVWVKACDIPLAKTTVTGYASRNKWRDRATVYDMSLIENKRASKEDRKSSVQEAIYQSSKRNFEHFQETIDYIMQDVRDNATIIMDDKVVNEDGVTEYRLRFTFDADTMKTVAETLALLNKELRTAVGLPSTISASKIDHQHNIVTFEDMIREREKQLGNGL